MAATQHGRFRSGEPTVFLDNGRRSDGPQPALGDLLLAASRGYIQAVVVPRPFVFALDDETAHGTVRQLHLQNWGCELYELPGH